MAVVSAFFQMIHHDFLSIASDGEANVVALDLETSALELNTGPNRYKTVPIAKDGNIMAIVSPFSKRQSAFARWMLETRTALLSHQIAIQLSLPSSV